MEEEQDGEGGGAGGYVGNAGVWGEGEVIVGAWVGWSGYGRHFVFVFLVGWK